MWYERASTAMTHRPVGTRFLLLFTMAAVLGSCRGPTDSSTHAARLILDVGTLTGVQQGDFTSVAERVNLIITDPNLPEGENVLQRLSQTIAPDEPEAVFQVEVEDGEVAFVAEVLSNTAVPLYFGGTEPITIDDDAFEVTIVPQAVNPVLVVIPRLPQFGMTDNGETRTFTAFMRVRNPGLNGLVWRVDSLTPRPQGVQILCRLFQQDGINCLIDRTWNTGQDEIVQVLFITPTGTGTLPTEGIRFVSNVGQLTVPTTP